MLDYMVTSNHIHLLVKDTGGDVIAESMQLVAGRTAQDYNQRKGRKGAFWEDHYHATAVESGAHLHRCLSYIDLNMVRAGVVSHPEKWKESGFHEIQKQPKRYAIINLQSLRQLSGFADPEDFRRIHREWVERGLENGLAVRDDRWSKAIAVGSLAFIDGVKNQLGYRAASRDVTGADGSYALREPTEAYAGNFSGQIEAISPENAFFWDESIDDTST